MEVHELNLLFDVIILGSNFLEVSFFFLLMDCFVTFVDGNGE